MRQAQSCLLNLLGAVFFLHCEIWEVGGAKLVAQFCLRNLSGPGHFVHCEIWEVGGAKVQS